MTSIRKDKSELKTLTEALEFACFRIMLELGGYNHFTFFQDNPPFYASSFFELVNMIQEKDDRERKDYKKAEAESKRKNKG